MESILEPAAGEAGAGRPEAGWRHYSTGRLTAAQAVSVTVSYSLPLIVTSGERDSLAGAPGGGGEQG